MMFLLQTEYEIRAVEGACEIGNGYRRWKFAARIEFADRWEFVVSWVFIVGWEFIRCWGVRTGGR